MANNQERLRDSASNYNTIYNNPESRFGVQNATVQKGSREQTLGSRPSEDGRRSRPKIQYKGQYETTSPDQSKREAQVDSRYYPDNQELSVPTPTIDSENKVGFIKNNVARVRAVPISATISLWAIPWYLFVQLPLGLFATFGIGISYGLFLISGQSTVAAAATETISGMSASAFFFIYLGLSGFIFFFYMCQIAIATAQFKIGFINPWFGRGTAFKICSILTVMIGSFIPILQMFPLLILWITAVIIYPK